MPKSFYETAEATSAFLEPASQNSNNDQPKENVRTLPFRDARLIKIEKIHPDKDQPRKTFHQESLESLAESIKELGGIIDPLTVEPMEPQDCYRIISGERRYRAAKISGLCELPCIIKRVDEKSRYLMQLVANLQREDIQPLEEAAGIQQLIEKYEYNQAKVARLFKKSRSYISQILGLERLEEPARQIIKSTPIPKEAQIQASREPDPEKQQAILRKASENGDTIRQLRQDRKANSPKYKMANSRSGEPVQEENETFREWRWGPSDRSFTITIRFRKDRSSSKRTTLCREALQAAIEKLDIIADSLSACSTPSEETQHSLEATSHGK